MDAARDRELADRGAELIVDRGIERLGLPGRRADHVALRAPLGDPVPRASEERDLRARPPLPHETVELEDRGGDPGRLGGALERDLFDRCEPLLEARWFVLPAIAKLRARADL